MIPTVSAPALSSRGQYPTNPMTALKTAQPSAPETARASAGETGAVIRAETTLAIDAPEQTAVAPRLRDQETAERTARQRLARDAPTGPPPAFDENLLERQVRTAFEPPKQVAPPTVGPATTSLDELPAPASKPAPVPDDTTNDFPEARTERAQAGFAESRALLDDREPYRVDLKQ